MSSEDLSLCCCEFYDHNQKRNHILACCCNCEDLDEGFEGLISGAGVPSSRQAAIMATLRDRFRIPWRGGAKQIYLDALLPILLIPLALVNAAFSFWRTILSFTLLFALFCALSVHLTRTMPKTKFFYVWMIVTLASLFAIFEFVVIPFLQILVEENIALSMLIGGFLLNLCLVRRAGRVLGVGEGGGVESGEAPAPRTHNCAICRVSVPDRDHHCVWYDCCIGSHNQCFFIMSLVFAEAALLYSSNLTLTSVCHPFVFYKTILLPDDCSEVYHQLELGLAFVGALYSLGLAFVVSILLFHQILLVSLGMTGHEWRTLPFSQKWCLGWRAPRPYSKGFFRNWSRIMCCTQKYQYSLVNQ